MGPEAIGAMAGAMGATTGAMGAMGAGPATYPGPEAMAAWRAAPLDARWSALAATTAGSSAGVTAPLGWATSAGTPARGPAYPMGPEAIGAMAGAMGATTGAMGAMGAGPATYPGPEAMAAWRAAPLDARWSALAATTAGSSAGVTAPLGWATRAGTPARGPTYGPGAMGAAMGPAYPMGPAAMGATAGAMAGPAT